MGSRPRGVGEAEVTRFAALGGFTLVALGVTDAGGAGCGVGSGIVIALGVFTADWDGVGAEPEAVRFRPVVGGGFTLGGPSPMNCSPKVSAV